jgi:hypothetical protein
MKAVRLRLHLPIAAIIAILALPVFILFFSDHDITDNTQAIPARYDYASYFHEDIACVAKKSYSLHPVSKWSFSQGYRSVIKTGIRFSYIDKTGKEAVPIKSKYDTVDFVLLGIIGGTPMTRDVFDFHEDRAAVIKNDKWGFIDKTGKEVIPPVFDGISYFQEGFAPVKVRDKWGFINKTGRVVVPPTYDFISDNFQDDLIQVGLNGKKGFVDKTGKEAIPPKFDHADYFINGLARVCMNDKWGIIDKTGKEIIPLTCDAIARPYGEGFFQVKANGKWERIDKRDKIIITPTLKKISHSLFPKGKNGKMGAEDITGKPLIPFIYDDLVRGIGDVWIATKNKKIGFIDGKTGKELVEPKYDEVRDDLFLHPNENYIPVKKDGKWGFVKLENSPSPIPSNKPNIAPK